VEGEISSADELITPILQELDKLKNDLGGSPIFGSHTPTLEDEYAKKTFLGIPLTTVKDWFRMILNKEWPPKFF
jgi:hypothetical protein